MAEAAIPPLVGSINEILGRILRIHEYELDCLRKENRFLASQVKASRSIRGHAETPQPTLGDSTSEPEPTSPRRSQKSAPGPSSASSTQLSENQQHHQAQAQVGTTETKPSANSDSESDGVTRKLSSSQLRQLHMAARMRVMRSQTLVSLDHCKPDEGADSEEPLSPVAKSEAPSEQEASDKASSQDAREISLPPTLAHEVNLDQIQLECATWAPFQSLQRSDSRSDTKDTPITGGGGDSDSVELCAVWRARRRSLGRLARRALSIQQKGERHLEVLLSQSTTASPTEKRNCMGSVRKGMYMAWQRRIARPSSKRRLFWDLIGMFLIGYDLIVIPLGTFDPPQILLLQIMAWVCTLYWTLDMPSTLLVGYHSKGVLEMRPTEITKHYIRTWLLFDVGVVCVDWMVTISENMNTGRQNSVGYLRFGRFGRFLRMFRLLRLLKLHGMLVEVFERIQSEFVRIMLGIANVLVFIVLVNHVIACGWYWVGTHSYESGLPSWIVAAELGQRHFGYNYTTSVHWSLTQFTPASMEVVPENAVERAYNVLTLLFAMCTFSSFVSSITNAMTRLRNLNSENVQKATVLRQYLKENRIPGEMQNRIWAWLQNIEDTSRCRIHEDQVAILPELPAVLQTELRSNIYRPVLVKHPFFLQFAGTFGEGLRNLYTSFVEVGLSSGKELFHCGEQAERMWFVLRGELRYLRDGDDAGFGSLDFESEEILRWSCSSSSTTDIVPEKDLVREGQWISEHPLWINWSHVGQMRGVCHSELFAIKAKRFQEVMQFEIHGVWQAAKYARCFLSFVLSSQAALSDVWADMCVLDELSTRAFTVTEDDIPSTSSDDGSSFYYSTPASRPSPPPLGRIHSPRLPSSRRHSQHSHRDSQTTQGSVRRSRGTPSQQPRNSVSSHEASDSDADVEMLSKQNSRPDGQGSQIRNSSKRRSI